MHEISVIGPIDGFYHIGYYVEESNKFYSMSQFVSKSLAETMAWKLGQDRVLAARKEP